jgi:hypothetical protein
VRAWHGGFELKAFATAVAISFAGFGGRVIRAAINDSDSTGDIPARRQPCADDMIHEWTPLPVCGQLETVGAVRRSEIGSFTVCSYRMAALGFFPAAQNVFMLLTLLRS